MTNFKIKNKCGMDLSQTEELFHSLGEFAQRDLALKSHQLLISFLIQTMLRNLWEKQHIMILNLWLLQFIQTTVIQKTSCVL